MPRKKKKIVRYVVASDRSLVTKSGILGPGVDITVDDIRGGRSNFDRLVAVGYIRVAE